VRHVLAELAVRQHGVVSVWQLMNLGYGRSAVDRLVAKGHLHRLHRGVYAVGHTRLTLRGWWMAAVLACGPGAVLSHRSAAALWELHRAASGPIDVTIPGRGRRGPKSVRSHLTRALDLADTTIRDGIPVTSIARTLLDFAETEPRQRLRRALETGERLELIDGRALHTLMARSAGRRGLRALNEALAAMNGSAPWTQSDLEDRFLSLIREAHLPEPQCNVVVEGYLVDCWWPAPRVVAEVDSFGFHKTREMFESDRKEDTVMQLAGITVLRPTERRIEHEPQALLSDVKTMLNGRAWGADR
jgi:very-short-patch-repair endonuclease